ncbi:hypothetical protein KSP39_PZI022113 [Platanthera zijinensis]|uniref:Uncharacterized protein n=1 Tax=Platanthera zijinensis TaxID=2320716 RepID=A0AAP0AYJ2_9ASPA
MATSLFRRASPNLATVFSHPFISFSAESSFQPTPSVPRFSFGASMELMAVPKKKVLLFQPEDLYTVTCCFIDEELLASIYFSSSERNKEWPQSSKTNPSDCSVSIIEYQEWLIALRSLAKLVGGHLK